MSEASFENSTYSEANSEEVSLPESSSLSPNQLINDDYSSSSSSVNTSLVGLSIHDNLTSLPVNLTPPTADKTSDQPQQQQQQPSYDAELLGLLNRRKPLIQTSAPKCAKCQKSVYKAEEVRAANKMFHKLCFKCTSCNKLLEAKILNEHQGDLYCKNCYGKNFGPKGYGYGIGAGIMSASHDQATAPELTSTNPLKPSFTSIQNEPSTVEETKTEIKVASPVVETGVNDASLSSSVYARKNSSPSVGVSKENKKTLVFGQTEKCARCEKSVYAAEKVNASGRAYHKLCFTCNTCKKLLNSGNFCDNSDNQIFCKACYGKQFGPKGVGYGVGAGTLSTAN